MELLLNLAWLLLAVPAYWLWRRQESSAFAARRLSSLQCLLALGCVLVLLFPVISASDDLHAMRAEMEESSSKRTVRHVCGDRNCAWTNRLHTPQAAVANANWVWVPEIASLVVPDTRLSVLSRPQVLRPGRAPPFSLLG
jgi:hypothetical protein